MPYLDATKAAEAKRRWQDLHRIEHCTSSRNYRRRVAKYKRENKEFVSIDGEALSDLPGKYHHLAASDGTEISDINGLKSEDCLEFLLDVARRNRGKRLVGFGLSYDCEMWIKDLSVEVWKTLQDADKDEKTPQIIIKNHRYYIYYLPRKWFELFYYDNRGKRVPCVIIDDTITLYQRSFSDVIEQWEVGTAEERLFIKTWKEKRATFTKDDWETIQDYNRLEMKLHIELTKCTLQGFRGCGIFPTRMYGPGAIADELMAQQKMNDYIGRHPEMTDIFNRAFFGGRFQIKKLGDCIPAHELDLISAYPAVIGELPSDKGVWEHVDGYCDAKWAVYRVRWRCNPTKPILPFPWRARDGSIHYPPIGEGWYYKPEVETALKHFPGQISVIESYIFHPEEEGVFAWVYELADKRAAAKAKLAAGDFVDAADKRLLSAIERCFKLALNSLYGKTVQSVGAAKYYCPFWGGWITSSTRAKVLDAACQKEESVILIATDGILTTEPLPLATGTKLGEWEDGGRGTVEVYQNGVYRMLKPEGKPKIRSRGIPMRYLDWDELRAEWRKNGLAGSYRAKPFPRLIGHRLALSRGKSELQATWEICEKVIHFGGSHGYAPDGDVHNWQMYYPSIWEAYYCEMSTPYDKWMSEMFRQSRELAMNVLE